MQPSVSAAGQLDEQVAVCACTSAQQVWPAGHGVVGQLIPVPPLLELLPLELPEVLPLPELLPLELPLPLLELVLPEPPLLPLVLPEPLPLLLVPEPLPPPLLPLFVLLLPELLLDGLAPSPEPPSPAMLGASVPPQPAHTTAAANSAAMPLVTRNRCAMGFSLPVRPRAYRRPTPSAAETHERGP
jgi:hypothetical protein